MMIASLILLASTAFGRYAVSPLATGTPTSGMPATGSAVTSSSLAALVSIYDAICYRADVVSPSYVANAIHTNDTFSGCPEPSVRNVIGSKFRAGDHKLHKADIDQLKSAVLGYMDSEPAHPSQYSSSSSTKFPDYHGALCEFYNVTISNETLTLGPLDVRFGNVDIQYITGTKSTHLMGCDQTAFESFFGERGYRQEDLEIMSWPITDYNNDYGWDPTEAVWVSQYSQLHPYTLYAMQLNCAATIIDLLTKSDFYYFGGHPFGFDQFAQTTTNTYDFQLYALKSFLEENAYTEDYEPVAQETSISYQAHTESAGPETQIGTGVAIPRATCSRQMEVAGSGDRTLYALVKWDVSWEPYGLTWTIVTNRTVQKKTATGTVSGTETVYRGTMPEPTALVKSVTAKTLGSISWNWIDTESFPKVSGNDTHTILAASQAAVNDEVITGGTLAQMATNFVTVTKVPFEGSAVVSTSGNVKSQLENHSTHGNITTPVKTVLNREIRCSDKGDHLYGDVPNLTVSITPLSWYATAYQNYYTYKLVVVWDDEPTVSQTEFAAETSGTIPERDESGYIRSDRDDVTVLDDDPSQSEEGVLRKSAEIGQRVYATATFDNPAYTSSMMDKTTFNFIFFGKNNYNLKTW